MAGIGFAVGDLVKRTTAAARSLGALVLLACWIVPAQAQHKSGFYVGAGAGFNFTEQQTTQLNLSISPGSGQAGGRVATRPINLGVGFAALGTAGYAFGNGARVEIEGNVRHNGATHVSGSETKYGVFANALYDANLGVPWMTPYVGLGVGFQAVNLNNMTVRSATGGPPSIEGGVSGQFAYQGIVGAGFPIAGVPGLSVTAEYHYVRTAGARSYQGTTETAAPTPNRVRLGDDVSHAMIVGLRFGFGAPAVATVEDEGVPPPLSSAMAPPARSYVVYFDANSAALSARARDVVAQAARASARLAYTRIEVSGHTDRTNEKASNVALSKARAVAVADELVRWGIARGIIEIHAFGDEKPAAIAPAGVSEPRNRRVEILYR